MIDLPPAEFDHAYAGSLTVIERAIGDVHAACFGKLGAPRIFACAFPLAERCVIMLPKVEEFVVSQQQQDRLRRHEIGHCNGWRH